MRITSKIYIIITVAMSILTANASPNKIVVPKPLKKGSRIALITPASAIKDEVIDTAIVKLQAEGYVPVVFPHAYGHEFGSYATTDENRAADLMAAFQTDSIDAIMCTRGGYGCVRLLPLIDTKIIQDNPKWLIGYSDISVLHAMMYNLGIASIHGPMTGHIASEPDSLAATQSLYQLLAEGLPVQYNLKPNAMNKCGEAKGHLVGGNMMTIDALSQTPYDILTPDDDENIILFIEDVDEGIYRIERLLMRLQQSGKLGKLKGLIIGQFTAYNPSRDFASMEDMFYYWLNKWGYYDKSNPMPIVYDFPTGHVSDNFPMVVGAMTTLKVTPDGTTLKFSKK